MQVIATMNCTASVLIKHTLQVAVIYEKCNILIPAFDIHVLEFLYCNSVTVYK